MEKDERVQVGQREVQRCSLIKGAWNDALGSTRNTGFCCNVGTE